MNYSFAYDNGSVPYNAHPPLFNLFYESFPENSLQQKSWHVQQQLPHLYWDQYAAPEQENYQSLQPLQDQFFDQWQQGIPSSKLQGLTNQVAELVAPVNKLTGRAEEEKEAATNEAPLMVAAAPKFQVINYPTTSVYSNPSFTDSHSALNSVNDDFLMSDDCIDAFADFAECVCEPYDHNYTDADFEKLVDGLRELAVIHDCNSFVAVPIAEFTTASVQLSENVYYDGR
ncbi:hypothetical protein LR48_Vigan50s010500 [Vigna angularis]|uniref:Uncharacterized protein n=1 Tax=Phaseolus angularis TaxID=3914 RepID=A0A0L9T3K4_PHAAN|nr:hypothetical protein LR48_Vigan50s010500 [Vigna angularis]